MYLGNNTVFAILSVFWPFYSILHIRSDNSLALNKTTPPTVRKKFAFASSSLRAVEIQYYSRKIKIDSLRHKLCICRANDKEITKSDIHIYVYTFNSPKLITAKIAMVVMQCNTKSIGLEH